MDTSPISKPPLDVEAAIDLVLATAAHRSNNPKHSEFGKLILEQYVAKMRQDYKDDPVAKCYLDNLFATIAAAIRGFSVERDNFGTQWQSSQEQKQYELQRVNRLAQFSPFTEKNIWGKLIGILGGAGFGGALGEVARGYIVASNLFVLSAVPLGAALGLVLLEVFLNWYRDRCLQKIANTFPDSLRAQSEKRSLTNYRVIIKQFLLSALKLREESYPELASFNGYRIFEKYSIPHIDFTTQPASHDVLANATELNEAIDAIVERHFAFR
jgi:hypothetical protein